MTSFPSEAYLGCSIPADKGKTFVQLIDINGKVLSSAFGFDHDEAVTQAMKIAGVAEIVGKRPRVPTAHRLDPYALNERPGGLLAACRQLSLAIDGLMGVMRAQNRP